MKTKLRFSLLLGLFFISISGFLYGQGVCDASFALNQSGGVVEVIANNYSPSANNTISWDGSPDTYFGGVDSAGFGPGAYIVCVSVVDTVNMCSDYYCDTFFVSGSPVCNAGFSSSDNGSGNFTFTSSSSSSPGMITNQSWDFGDGGSAIGNPGNHTYTADGVYNVCLTILSSDSCTSTSCSSVSVFTGVCDASFSLIDSGLDVFTSNTSSPFMMYEWFWGDGSPSSLGVNPGHSYSSPGTYWVCLYLSDTMGNFCDSTCNVITVSGGGSPTCDAGFNYFDLGSGAFSFSSSATSSPGVIWDTNWDYGDGFSGFGNNVTHTYGSAGMYLVCQTIFTADSCTSTYCDSIVVGGTGPVCSPSFALTSSGLDVTTNNTTMGGSSFEWYWGDGSPVSLGFNQTHSFTSSGAYWVCLYVYDSIGNFCDSTCNVITVTGSGSPTCDAGFNYVDLMAFGAFSFNSTATSSPGVIWDTNWDYGDGFSGFGSNVTHTYGSAGMYLVCQTIFTADSCTSTYCDTVLVSGTSPQCTADFVSSVSGSVVTFSNTSTSNQNYHDYYWTFGDGSWSSDMNPSHTYGAAGTYTVCLDLYTMDTITGDSCYSTYCDPITVSGGGGATCDAGFNYVDLVAFGAFSFNSTATSSPGVIWDTNWDYGDGFSGFGSNVTHTYGSAGMYLVCQTIFTADSCTSTYCDTVLVSGTSPQCTADFVSSVSGSVVTFSNTSTSNQNYHDYYWTFGDGSTSYDINPTHTYGAAGTYTVCLDLYTMDTITGDSCYSTYCDPITVSGGGGATCDAGFTSSNWGSGSFNFTSSATSSPGVIWDTNWDFGDGFSGFGSNVTHTYGSAGMYLVCQTIFTADSCTSTYCDTVLVSGTSPQCTADFVSTVSGSVVTFSNTSTSNQNYHDYYWTFGDGSTSYDINPTHTYGAAGTYTVCLDLYTMDTITGDSCFSTYCNTVVVGGSNPTCSVSFGLTNTGGLDVATNNTTTGGGTYEWWWGDGSMNTTGFNQTHTYATSGTYDVCLYVYDSAGAWCDSTCNQITVSGGTSPQCTADFVFTVAGNDVTFSNTSTSNQNYHDYYWTFGDGATSSDINPMHTYASAGTYTVCLDLYTMDTITGDSCFSTYCNTVVVGGSNPTCSVSFGLTNTGGLDVATNNTTTGGGTYEWWWGDGSMNTTGYNQTHTYATSGTYDVCLYVYDSAGAWCDSTCNQITVSGGTSPQCTADFVSTVAGNDVTFSNTSTSNQNYHDYYWTFGDGSWSSDENPVHSYAAAGTYMVCLDLYTMDTLTGDSCFNTYCDTIVINTTTPVCDASYDFVQLGNQVQFSDQSTASGTILSWTYDFGDATVATSPDPIHSYADSGWYSVCLTIVTVDSCFSTFCDSVYVSTPSTSACEANFNVDYLPSTLIFSDASTSLGNIIGWSWDLGDGNQSFGPYVTHSYQNPGTYTVCLTIETDDSCFATSCQTINTAGPSALYPGEESMMDLKVYPNPVSDMATIEFELLSTADIAISIVDVQGRIVFNSENQNSAPGVHRTVWNADGLGAGMYFVKISVDNQMFTKKVILN